MSSQKEEGGCIRPFFLECSSQSSLECTESYVCILLASEVPDALLRDHPAQKTFSTLPVSLFILLCVFCYRSFFGFLKARRCQKASLLPLLPSQSMFLASLCPSPREPLSHSGSPPLLPRQSPPPQPNSSSFSSSSQDQIC